MNLHDYFLSGGKRQSDIAREVGVSPVIVHQWAHGKRRVPADRCPSIERATDGAVRCEELRPDVDWQYLRQTSAAPATAA